MNKKTEIRKIVRKSLAVALLAVAAVPALAASKIDLNTPEGNVMAQRKIQCSTVDGKPVFYWWTGKVFARRMGERDQHLFNIEGMNVRTCGTVDGGKQGKSFRLVSREILLYTDPKTGQPIDEWKNVWTGETVKVLHVENDPVNQPPFFPYDANGKPNPWSKFAGQTRGDFWWQSSPIPLYYHNVLAGDYQRQIGGAYHASELFNFSGDLESLTSDEFETANIHVGWVRISDWLPWMMMEGREGIMYMHAAGRKVAGFDELGPVMKEYINTKAPLYKAPPPVDDNRPNETSWTYYKKMVKGGPLPKPGKPK